MLLEWLLSAILDLIFPGGAIEGGFDPLGLLRECVRTPRRVMLIVTILSLDGAAVYLLWHRFPAWYAMACFFAGGLVFIAGVLLSWRQWSKEERGRLARVRSMAEREREGHAS
jgi:hypothetical protein